LANPHTLKRTERRGNRLSIRDKAGWANLVVAVLAIAISLVVFRLQSISDDKTSQVLRDSQTALEASTKLLSAEQTQLSLVANDLGLADKSLGQLETHADSQVAELNAADRALKDAVSTAKAQYKIDRGILSTSQSLFAISNAERADRIAVQRARPNLQFSLEYRNGNFQWDALQAAIERKSVITFPIGHEAQVSFVVVVRNLGRAVAKGTYLFIVSDGLQLTGCFNQGPALMQCGPIPDVLIGGASYGAFTVENPKTAGIHVFSIQAATQDAAGTSLRFQQIVRIYLPGTQ
jgi:hypothetical protein